MKKLFYLLFILLLLPIGANAGTVAPTIKQYEATIINSKGASYYKEDDTLVKVGTLKNGYKITIEDELLIKSSLYGIFSMNDNYYFIKLVDILPISEKYIPDETEKLSKNKSGLVLGNDIYLYNGPARAYKKVTDMIPKNTSLVLTHTIKVMSWDSPWYYTEYNGVKGWIDTYDYNFAFKNPITKYLVPNEINMYKNAQIYSNPTVIGNIPVNTAITNEYVVDITPKVLYITYKNITGYIAKDDLATSNTNDISIKLLAYKFYLYKSASTESEVLIDNIPKGTIFNYLYTYSISNTTWYYVKYNNQKGWIYGSLYEEPITIMVNDDQESSSDIQSSSEDIISSSLVTNTSSNSLKKIILFCISGAFVISLTTFVTISLFNRKKLLKKNNK